MQYDHLEGEIMSDQGFNGERDLYVTRQTAAIIVCSVLGLLVLAFILGG